MNWKPLIALPLLVVAACGTINIGIESATPKHAEYSAPAHPASAASVTLDSSPEDITVKPFASVSENYFEAQIDYIGTITYNANAANDRYEVTLTENANNLSYNGAPLKWDVAIDPAAPLALDASSSSGALSLDLSEFTLTGFSADTSSGSIDATLPATDQQYNASLTTSSGTVTATVEDGAQVSFTTIESSSGNLTLNTGGESSLSARIKTSSGAVTVNGGDNISLTASISVSSGDVDLNFGTNADADITFSSSSGGLQVDVPESTAVRLEVAQNSSGGVNVPGWLRQLSGDAKTGVWESDGYDLAAHQISIIVTSDSSGDIQVQ